MSFDASGLLIILLLMGLLSIVINILIAIAGVIAVLITRRAYLLMLVFGLSLVINSGFVYYLMTLQILDTWQTCAIIALCVLVIVACASSIKHHTGLLLTTIAFQGLCLLGFATILSVESYAWFRSKSVSPS